VDFCLLILSQIPTVLHKTWLCPPIYDILETEKMPAPFHSDFFAGRRKPMKKMLTLLLVVLLACGAAAERSRCGQTLRNKKKG
jgi:hypothetical protein